MPPENVLFVSKHQKPRCQDFFMHNNTYGEIIRRLYNIGVYGSAEASPDYLSCFEKRFERSPCQTHVSGIERRLYRQKLQDNVLDVAEVRAKINSFIRQGE